MHPEPITRFPPRAVHRPLATQGWRDVTFLHWPYDPVDVRRVLPPQVEPDIHEGTTYVGVVGLRMVRVRLAGTPPLPYLGDFLETNVRVYSVDRAGRRGVVFLSMEASRLAFVLGARGAAQLPYRWAAMHLDRDRDGVLLDYRTTRRWPRPRRAGLRFRVSIGGPVDGTPLDRFVADRWGLHASTRRGRLRYLPVAHEPWPLHSAELVEFREEGLLEAAGLPAPQGPPTSVLYAPSTHSRIGIPISDR
ncbi:MAG: DUF2071 domain-containing protein [Streptosporangiales bacterium]|nr:DUF2071 domain-containing protein [Streptosporangiales bacterium]